MDAFGFILAVDWRVGEDDFTSDTIQMTHDTEYDLIEIAFNGKTLTFDSDQADVFLEAFQNMFDRLGCVGNGKSEKYQ